MTVARTPRTWTGRPLGLSGKTGPLAVRVPYVTVDGFLAVRTWRRPAHAEVDRIDVTDRTLTVAARLHGSPLAEDARVELRLRRDKAVTRTLEPLVEADGRGFSCTVDESVYNPIGAVHGGLVCTLLDSVAGCAVHTTLPAGVGYTSIELKVTYLRAVTRASGPLTAVGTVVKPGRRVSFAEGQVFDAAGKLVATASSSLLVFPLPA